MPGQRLKNNQTVKTLTTNNIPIIHSKQSLLVALDHKGKKKGFLLEKHFCIVNDGIPVKQKFCDVQNGDLPNQ
jgi:hypothetical protein